MKNSDRLALIGFVLLLPASILICSGLLEFNVPGLLVHPVAVMGGLLTAVLINLLPIIRVQLEHAQNGALAAVTVRIGTKAINLAILAICALLLATIMAYLFIENFQPRLIQ